MDQQSWQPQKPHAKAKIQVFQGQRSGGAEVALGHIPCPCLRGSCGSAEQPSWLWLPPGESLGSSPIRPAIPPYPQALLGAFLCSLCSMHLPSMMPPVSLVPARFLMVPCPCYLARPISSKLTFLPGTLAAPSSLCGYSG